jgi:hypothetical protein
LSGPESSGTPGNQKQPTVARRVPNHLYNPAMSRKKRNHFVPQSYLRAFAADGERKKIWTFRKNDGDFELRSIKKVAVSFYLYAPNGPNGRDYSFEDKLASLENWFGEDFWKEVTTGFVNLGSPTVRKGISLLAAVMFLRNPLALEDQRRVHQQLVKLYENRSGIPEAVEIGSKVYDVDPSEWPKFRDATEDDIKRMWIDQIGNATWLTKIMVEMRWSILLADEPVFVTSDNPVSVVHPTLEFKGFKNPNTFVSFPLSPTRILHLDNRHNEPDNQYYPLKASPGTMNSLIWRNSIDAMFSHRHTALVCQEMCHEAERMGFRWQSGGWLPDSLPPSGL